MNIIFHFSKNFSFLHLVDNEVNSWFIQDYAFEILWHPREHLHLRVASVVAVMSA